MRPDHKAIAKDLLEHYPKSYLLDWDWEKIRKNIEDTKDSQARKLINKNRLLKRLGLSFK